jgi:hypothetical protein
MGDVNNDKEVKVVIDDPWEEFADGKFSADDEDSTVEDKINKAVEDHAGEEEFEDDTEDFEDELDDAEETEDEKEVDQKDEKPKGNTSKEQAAIIELKRKNKELAQKLAEADAKKAEEQQRAKDSLNDEAEIQRLVDEEGMSETAAKRLVASDRRAINLEAKIERDRFERKLDKLEKDYPGISDHADEIWGLSRSGMTPQEIYKARFADTELTFDKKTKAEQDVLARQQAGKAKANVKASPAVKSTKEVKLSREDERAFQFLKKREPSMTRERFKKYSNY